MIARHLAVRGFEAKEHLSRAGMNHADLRATVRDYFRAQLADARRRINKQGPLTDEQKTSYEQTQSLLEMGNQDFWQLVGRKNAEEELDQFFDNTGLSREDYHDRLPLVLDEIRKARIGANRAIIEYAATLEHYDFTEAVRPSLRAVEDQLYNDAYPSTSEAVEAFFREHEKTTDWTAGTFQKRRAALDVAVEWFGAETSMATIGKREAAEFKDALLSLPTNRFKNARLQGLSLRDAIAVPDVPTISNATANAYLSAYKIFWEWAERHGYAPEAQFQGMSVGKKGKGSKDRKPFTQEALEKTYTALTDPSSKFYTKTSHRWATLIAMFSGARLNEVAQLHIEDIVCVDGVWVFDFNEDGDGEKRLKSPAALRRVPIHSQLIELGLLDFHERQRADGYERLFPDYTYTPKSGYGDKLSKWFNRTFTGNLGIKSDAHVFHGLRHTFATRLIQADIPTERVQFIIGHEREGVTHQVYAKDGYTLYQTTEAVEQFSVRESSRQNFGLKHSE